MMAGVIALCLAGNNSLCAQEDLSLEKAIATGLANNFSILLQRNEAQVARNNNTLGNAGFLPSLSLSATQNNTFSTTHQEQFSGAVKDVDNAVNNSFNTGVQLNWTLFDGMNMFAGKKALDILQELGENGSRLVVEGTVADITLAWCTIVQLKKLVKVTRDAVDLSMRRKAIAVAKVSLGAGSQLMLLQSTVDLNADSTRLVRQLAQLEQARADLNQLMARDPQTPFDITDSIRTGNPGTYDQLLKEALAQNTSLIAARLSLDLARQELRQTRSDRYPVFWVSGGYSYSTLQAQTGFLKSNQAYGPSVAMNLSYNLFNGFNVNRAVRNAKVSLNSGEIGIEEATQEVKAGIFRAVTDFLASMAIVAMQDQNVNVARENVTIAFEKYQIGSINDIELREIQQKQIDAESQLILAQFDAKKAEVELERLTGRLVR